MRPSSSEKLRKWRNIYKWQLEHTRSHLRSASCAGLPLVTMGVYLPGKLWVDNCFACPSTTAASMYLVAFVSIAGANWSSSANFIFYFSRRTHIVVQISFSSAKVICQHMTSLKPLADGIYFIFTFILRRQNFLLSILGFRYYYSCLQKGWRLLIWENENKQNKTDPKLGFALLELIFFWPAQIMYFLHIFTWQMILRYPKLKIIR